MFFFAHTQNSKSVITSLKTELKMRKEEISEERYRITEKELNRALENYEKYGRKIFAIGQVVEKTEIIAEDDPFYSDPSLLNTKSRNFSCITNIFELKHPVSLDDYKDFIAISKTGSITPVYGEKFTRLRELICEKNKDMDMPMYFLKSTAANTELSDLSNGKWMQIENTERKKFNTKNIFQSYYTDYLLQEIGDTNKVFTNCRYRKPNSEDAFMDNVISFGNRYLAVKIIPGIPPNEQASSLLERYCNAEKITLSKDKIAESHQIYSDTVLGIDLSRIFVYNANTKEISTIYQLDDLKTDSDLSQIKEKLRALSGSQEMPNDEQVPQSEGISGSMEKLGHQSNESTEKSDSVESAAPLYQGAVYVPAEYPVTPIGWAEYCLPSKKTEIAERAVLIAECEKVIQRDKLIETLRTSFGVKASDKVLEATEKALKAAKIKTTKIRGISYCWASAIDPKTYTSFRYHEEVKRRDDALPLPELRNAVVRTLMDNGPLDENELLVRTARTFGYQRLGPNLRNRLSEGIAYAVSDKLIRLNKQKKYELREA